MNNSEKTWKILVWDQETNQIQVEEVSQKLFFFIMKDDLRYQTLKNGLKQLSNPEIGKIINYQEEMVFDQFNFDESTKRFWPLAVGLGVAELFEPATMTNKLCQHLMLKIGGNRPNFTLNPMRGIRGNFYQQNRKEDLIQVCLEIISERHETS